MGSFRAFVAALRQTGSHATVVYLCFTPFRLFSWSPGFLSSSSRFRCASGFVVFCNAPGRIRSIHISRRSQTRGRSCSIRVLLWRRSCTADAASQPREHPSKFTLDAWIVSSRSDVLGLRSLYRLRQRRIATFSVELRADVQDRPVDRSITSFSIRPMSLHALVLFVSKRPLVESITIAVQLRHVGYWW
jgi:hypothetical protein